jgi:hypothetical protein
MSELSDHGRPASESSALPDKATLYVRSLSPGVLRARQEQVVERLETLSERDTLAAMDVSVWGEQISLDPATRSEAANAIYERVETLRDWAEAHDRTIEPVFEERTCDSSLTGDRHEVLVLPVMVLAEYRDGSLHHVSPAGDGSSVQTVTDRLDVLEDAARTQQIA